MSWVSAYDGPASPQGGGRNRNAVSGGGLPPANEFHPHPKFARTNFDLPPRGRLIGLAILAVFALFASASCGAHDASQASFTDAENGTATSESICINNQSFQGCCSGKGGVKNIRGTQLACNNGDFSPSCNGDITTKLRGCCSHNDGINFVETNGVVFCANETQSKTCRIYLRGCESI